MFKTYVKITVVKVHVFEDLASDFGHEILPNGKRTVSPCPFFHEGDTFYYNLKTGILGGDFCECAKGAIFTHLVAVASQGGATPKENWDKLRPSLTCCTDAVRPVIFKLEAVESLPDDFKDKKKEEN